MTLILWKAPVVDDPEEAKRLLTPWYIRNDDSAFEANTNVSAVHDELLRQYPYVRNEDSNPWADPPELTDRLLVLSIRWGTDSPVLADITVLARKSGLVLYDPQGSDIFLPTDPIQDLTELPRPTLFEWVKAFAIAAILVGLTFAAWHIPIGWLRWVATVLVGFVAAAGLFVVGAMVAGALGFVDVSRRD